MSHNVSLSPAGIKSVSLSKSKTLLTMPAWQLHCAPRLHCLQSVAHGRPCCKDAAPHERSLITPQYFSYGEYHMRRPVRRSTALNEHLHPMKRRKRLNDSKRSARPVSLMLAHQASPAAARRRVVGQACRGAPCRQSQLKSVSDRRGSSSLVARMYSASFTTRIKRLLPPRYAATHLRSCQSLEVLGMVHL